MSNIQPKNNADSLDLLIEQFKTKPFFNGILDSMVEQFDELDQSIFEIRDNIYLDVAEGVQLDIIAEIVDVNRNGANDSDFREAIRNEFDILLGSGEPEKVIQTVKTLYNGTFVHYYPGHLSNEPASFIIVTDATITNEQMERFSPAGVGCFIGDYLIEEDPANEFIILENNEKIIITG